MGARICPRCATRVDERRAKASPFCLSCGAPLAPNAAPTNAGPTFSGKVAGAGGGGGGHGPPVGLIIGIIAGVILLGLGAVVVLLVLLSRSSTPEPTPVTEVTTGGAPPIETPTVPASVVPTVPSGKAPPPHTASTSAATAPKTATTPIVASAFPRTKAQSEVDRVGSTLAGCKRASGPFGSGSIRVDFEPDGRVGTLTRPPFAGTPVGSCISARFLTIKIGAFQGSTQSIEHAFIIQD